MKLSWSAMAFCHLTRQAWMHAMSLVEHAASH
jgi:hypothetical protein